MIFGGLETIWIIVMFDLPTDTKAARRAYTDFRKSLLSDGYTMMQYSIYMRHCSSDDNAKVHSNRVKNALPDDGEIRILKITDKQFGCIEVYFGKKRKETEPAPIQLQFF